MNGNNKLVLYIEDDPDDCEFLSEAFREISAEVDMRTAANGVEAMAWLHRRMEEGSPLPSLIVLDLNMPLLNGGDTFLRLRAHPVLKQIPVVVFTSSENPQDKALFQRLGVELITKPDHLSYLYQIAGHMLSHCALP